MSASVELVAPAVKDGYEYWYEKYALIRFGRWLESNGYEVRLSVPWVGRAPGPLGGLKLPALPPERGADKDFRFTVYYDTPGGVDLVATRPEDVLLVEGKGTTTRSNAPRMVAEAVGKAVLLFETGTGNERYAVLLPDHGRVIRTLNLVSPRNAVFAERVEVYLISSDGSLGRWRLDG